MQYMIFADMNSHFWNRWNQVHFTPLFGYFLESQDTKKKNSKTPTKVRSKITFNNTSSNCLQQLPESKEYFSIQRTLDLDREN